MIALFLIVAALLVLRIAVRSGGFPIHAAASSAGGRGEAVRHGAGFPLFHESAGERFKLGRRYVDAAHHRHDVGVLKLGFLPFKLPQAGLLLGDLLSGFLDLTDDFIDFRVQNNASFIFLIARQPAVSV
jgi:hypothetical protein